MIYDENSQNKVMRYIVESLDSKKFHKNIHVFKMGNLNGHGTYTCDAVMLIQDYELPINLFYNRRNESAPHQGEQFILKQYPIDEKVYRLIESSFVSFKDILTNVMYLVITDFESDGSYFLSFSDDFEPILFSGGEETWFYDMTEESERIRSFHSNGDTYFEAIKETGAFQSL